jgi:hypothetical protein
MSMAEYIDEIKALEQITEVHGQNHHHSLTLHAINTYTFARLHPLLPVVLHLFSHVIELKSTPVNLVPPQSSLYSNSSPSPEHSYRFRMLPTKVVVVLVAPLLKAALAAPEPEVVRAVDLEDRDRERRACVNGAGGNVCLNGPYRKCSYQQQIRDIS